MSAQFLALPGETRLLGVARQWIGLKEVHAAPFAWCGASYPANVPAGIAALMHAVGATLAAEAGLRGLFGCDFVVDERVPWLTEVNPRYTAAMELVDHACGASLVRWHVEACLAFSVPDEVSRKEASSDPHSIPPLLSRAETSRPGRVFGKLVLFADRDLVMGDATSLIRGCRDDVLPSVADLSNPGTRIATGHPVCSFLAEAASDEDCLPRLLREAAQFRSRYLRADVPH